MLCDLYTRRPSCSVAIRRRSGGRTRNAADITTAFNKLAGETVFAGLSFRALSQSVFVEAARALQPSLAAKPRAMLGLVNVTQPRGPSPKIPAARGRASGGKVLR